MPKSNVQKSTGPDTVDMKESAISKSTPAKPGSNESQLAAFDKAMKLFHKRDFAAALPLFEEAAKGADVSVAHASQLHARMCNQRLDREVPQFKTAEDNYAYALSLIGRRELAGAEEYLQRAMKLAPRADYVLYSLALVKGLQGDISASAGFLNRAIELQPNNRSTARTDPEFHELLSHQAIRELVY